MVYLMLIAQTHVLAHTHTHSHAMHTYTHSHAMHTQCTRALTYNAHPQTQCTYTHMYTCATHMVTHSPLLSLPGVVSVWCPLSVLPLFFSMKFATES